MRKFTFYVGTNDKDLTIQRQYDDEYFINTFKNVFDDFTYQKATGLYTMQTYPNTTIIEETFIITVINNFSDMNIKNICKYLKNQLNQESILVQIESFNGGLY